MDSRIIAGIVVDYILNHRNANLIEKISFRNGTRYALAIETHYTTIYVHVVGKENKIFIELWHPSNAEPLLILDYDVNIEPKQMFEDLNSIIDIIWGSSTKTSRK